MIIGIKRKGMEMKLMLCVMLILNFAVVGLAEEVVVTTASGTFGADTYVVGGENGLKNYGGAANLLIKHGGIDYERKTYIRFDLWDGSWLFY